MPMIDISYDTLDDIGIHYLKSSILSCREYIEDLSVDTIRNIEEISEAEKVLEAYKTIAEWENIELEV